MNFTRHSTRLRRYIIYSLFVFGYSSVHGMQPELQDQVKQLNTLFKIIIKCSVADSQEDLLSFVLEIDEKLEKINSEIAKFENSSFSQIKLAVAVQVLFERIRSMVTEAQNSIISDDVENFIACIKEANLLKTQVFTLLADIDPASESIIEQGADWIGRLSLYSSDMPSDVSVKSLMERTVKVGRQNYRDFIYKKLTSKNTNGDENFNNELLLKIPAQYTKQEQKLAAKPEFNKQEWQEGTQKVIVPLVLAMLDNSHNGSQDEQDKLVNFLGDWLIGDSGFVAAVTDNISPSLKKIRQAAQEFLQENNYTGDSFRSFLSKWVSQTKLIMPLLAKEPVMQHAKERIIQFAQPSSSSTTELQQEQSQEAFKSTTSLLEFLKRLG